MPLAMNKIPMTVEGHQRLQEELKHLKSVERPAIIRAIAEARTHGDLAENAEYHAARERQSFIEGRLADLEDKLARAEVIDISKLSGSVVKFGATVTLSDEETDAEQTFRIVGEDEANIKDGRLSVTSPLARALIGKGQGDSVEVSTPRGPKSYEVVTVDFG
jgi:transcription elongation factor GreA